MVKSPVPLAMMTTNRVRQSAYPSVGTDDLLHVAQILPNQRPNSPQIVHHHEITGRSSSPTERSRAGACTRTVADGTRPDDSTCIRPCPPGSVNVTVMSLFAPGPILRRAATTLVGPSTPLLLASGVPSTRTLPAAPGMVRVLRA